MTETLELSAEPSHAEKVTVRIVRAIAETAALREEEIQLQSRLVEDLGLDSLDTVEAVMAVEDEFDIEIPDEEAEKLKKVSDVISYVTSKA